SPFWQNAKGRSVGRCSTWSTCAVSRSWGVTAVPSGQLPNSCRGMDQCENLLLLLAKARCHRPLRNWLETQLGITGGGAAPGVAKSKAKIQFDGTQAVLAPKCSCI